jgi:hypothetical protein
MKQKLIDIARRTHGNIVRLDPKKEFTEEPGIGLIFWYNDSAGSTHAVMAEKIDKSYVANV